MNKKLVYIMSFLLAGIVMPACEDEDKQMFDDFQRGAIPIFSQNEEDTGFIDLTDPSQTVISFMLDKEESSPVNSIDVTITYNNSETGESNKVVFTNVSTLPSEVAISMGQLLSAFEPDIVTADSLSLGDSFLIEGAMKMADGRYLNGGYSPSIFSERTISLTYNVACPSDLGGTLNFETTDITAGAGGDADACGASTSGTVTFASLGGGRYNVSDISFGQYACAWGDTPAAGVTLTDLCNNLSLTGTDQYGLVYSISIVSNDGTELVIDWENDYGDSGRTTLTRTDGKEWPLGLMTE